MSDNERKHPTIGFTIWASGNHPAGWRLPEARADGTFDPDFIRTTVETAERGLLDYYFIGDRVVGLPNSQSVNEILRPEALTLTSFVAAVSTHIGIISTVNTTYAEPYHVARATAQIDHLSKGRSAWNIVTGKNEEAAQNFGRDAHWDAAKRYEWTDEFVRVVKGLWDSWEDDALQGDKERGLFIDPSKVHQLNFRGKHFSVDGPLNIARPPQGHVPILHAGSSEDSHEFGAEHADIRFIQLGELKAAKDYYADLQRRRLAHGHPEGQQTVAGLSVWVAGTAREAHEKYRQVQNLTTFAPNVVRASQIIGVDLTGVDLDERIAQVEALTDAGVETAFIIELAQEAYGDADITVRELVLHALRSNGKRTAIGDGRQIADFIEEYFEERATDGFTIFPSHLPGPLDLFVGLVIPELQRRDLFKKSWGAPKTFRETFGLASVPNQFVSTPAGVAS